MVFLIAAASLRAQTPDTATIQGKVTDQTHAPVPGARITAVNTLTGLRRTAQTDTSGRFSLPGLPIGGTYVLTVQKVGFAETRIPDISLVAGRTADFHLQVSIAGKVTHVTVTGVVGQVRSDEPQLGIRLSTTHVHAVPLLNRRITYLPLLDAANAPTIKNDMYMNQNMFNSSGTGRRQTWFEVDGANGVDLWGRQTIFTNIPLDAVQEMTVLNNAFSADYGFTAGSVVNIVTQSGGNRWHGSLLGMWRPSATEARLSGFTPGTASSGKDLTSDTLAQTAFDLSGPIGASHRTHFAADFEYSRQNRASPVTSPIAPGNFIGQYRDYLGFLRVDHRINENNRVFLRLDADAFKDTNPNGIVGGNSLPSTDRISHRRTYTAALGETAVLSPGLLNDVNLQFQLGSPITQFSPVIYGPEYVVPVSTGGTFMSGTSSSDLLLNHQYEANDTVSWVVGRHTIAFGVDMIHSHNGGDGYESGGPIYQGQLTYNVCTQPLSVCESPAYLDNIDNVVSYTQAYGNGAYTVNDTLWNAFFQDNYRVKPHLTIDLGLSYELQTFTNSWHDFAPRVGFAWDMFGNGTTVLRGGFGIYYSQIIDNIQGFYTLDGPAGVFTYTAGPGQPGFPTSVSEVPLPSFPPGATAPVRTLYIRPGENAYLNQFFPTKTLKGYPNQLLNPYTDEWTFGIERKLLPNWILSIDYVGSHTWQNYRFLDVNAPAPFIRTEPGQVRAAQQANCTRPYWIWWYQQHDMTCDPNAPTNPEPPYAAILSTVNDGWSYYNALDVNLNHTFRHGLSMLASYTWSHTIDNVDPDTDIKSPSENPNDPNFTGAAEKGNALFDEAQRFVLSGIYTAPLQIQIGGVATLGSSFPFNIVTGVNNSGDLGATNDRPVINSHVIGRDTGHGQPIYTVDPFVARAFSLTPSGRVKLDLRAEAFNVFNHPNFIGYSGTWGNGATPGPGFGQPLSGISNQLPAREMQFSAKLSF